jgi:hypothetical protein
VTVVRTIRERLTRSGVPILRHLKRAVPRQWRSSMVRLHQARSAESLVSLMAGHWHDLCKASSFDDMEVCNGTGTGYPPQQ